VTNYGVFYWPPTIHSRRAQLVCPYGGVTPAADSAYRWCNVSESGWHVEWTQPDYDDCSTVKPLIYARSSFNFNFNDLRFTCAQKLTYS